MGVPKGAGLLLPTDDKVVDAWNAIAEQHVRESQEPRYQPCPAGEIEKRFYGIEERRYQYGKYIKPIVEGLVSSKAQGTKEVLFSLVMLEIEDVLQNAASSPELVASILAKAKECVYVHKKPDAHVMGSFFKRASSIKCQAIQGHGPEAK